MSPPWRSTMRLQTARGVFDMVLNMVYYRTMIKLNINQAKTHLSAYLARLRQGETIVLCKRNTPIAEIRPLPHPRLRKRPIGLAAGEFTVPASFFDPLPQELVAAFGGESESS